MLAIKKLGVMMVVGCATLASLVTTAATKVQHWKTLSGVPVYFAQRNNLPMLDAAVVFAAGSARDGKQFGLANLTQQLMVRETHSYDEDSLSNRLESVGAIECSVLVCGDSADDQ